MKKPQLRALFVSIDNYPIPEHRLNGCVNDMLSVKQAIEQRQTEEIDLTVKTLIDAQATRQNVIDTFQSFYADLEDGDTALFYYSGHGAEVKAPEAFWHSSPNKLLETLVCYDSRLRHGHDLRDKELSWLIWQATKDKDIQFTVIMDCCHSGNMTRGEKVRQLVSRGNYQDWETFLGAADYVQNNGNVTVKSGRHLLLSACRNDETAKEKPINGVSRGIFTYSLIEALENAEEELSYRELMNQVQEQVDKRSFRQHPQLGGTHPEDELRPFLGKTLKAGVASFYVHKDKRLGWVVNVGVIHGIPNSSTLAKTELLIYPIGATSDQLKQADKAIAKAQIDRVFAAQSTVSGLIDFDGEKTFKAVISSIAREKMLVGMDATGGRRGSSPTLLKDALEREPSAFIEFTDDLDKAQCVVSSKSGQFQLEFKAADNTPFETLHSYRENSLGGLIQDLEKVARWLQIKDLDNQRTLLDERDLELEFYNVLQTSPDFLHALDEQLVPDFVENGVDLPYIFDANESDPDYQWIEPSFRLKLKNPEHNYRPLWVSVLYLNSDFSIKNDLRRPQQLNPGEEVWMEAFDEDHEAFTSVVPMTYEDFHQNGGLNVVTERFKIIVSTQQIDTSVFNQKGLVINPEELKAERGQGRRSRRKPVDNTDWRTIDFEVRVSKNVVQ